MIDTTGSEETSSRIERFERGLNRIAVSRDGRRLATSDVDMNVEVFEGDQKLFFGNFGSTNDKVKPMERIRGLEFSPNGKLLYVAAGDQLSAIDLDDDSMAWNYVAPRSFGFLIISPISLDVSDQGSVAVAFDNGTFGVWDSKGTRQVLLRDNDSPRTLRYAPDGQRIVCTDSFSLCVWDIPSRRRKLKVRVTDRVYGMDLHRSGEIAATRTLQDIVLWDLNQKDIVGVIPVRPGLPILAFHPSEQWIAYGESEFVKVADFSGNLISTFELNVASALSLVFSPSGEELYVGCTRHRLERLKVARIGA